MLTQLNGYKAYIVAGAAVLYAIAGFISGNIDANTAIQVLLAAFGGAALRHGIATSAQ